MYYYKKTRWPRELERHVYFYDSEENIIFFYIKPDFEKHGIST